MGGHCLTVILGLGAASSNLIPACLIIFYGEADEATALLWGQKAALYWHHSSLETDNLLPHLHHSETCAPQLCALHDRTHVRPVWTASAYEYMCQTLSFINSNLHVSSASQHIL
jgi:hypothetical protein